MDIAHFSGKEIIEMAIRIEENGVGFYTQACSASKSERIKKLFLSLAEEEKKHISCFKNIGRHVKDDTFPGIFDPNLEEAPLYLKALADSRVFTNLNEGKLLASKARSEEEVLKTAINIEKDSILFYYELRNAINDKDKLTLKGLIEEEKKHLQKLTELQQDLRRNAL